MGGSSLKKPMIITFVSLLTDLISFTVILPLLPSILEYYRDNDPSHTYSAFAKYAAKIGDIIGAPAHQSETVLMGGLLGSMFSLLQFVSAPIIGAFSDVYGRKPALVLCMIGICFSHVLWLLASTFPLFILARVVGGISRANVSLSTTIVADDCTDELRPKGMAMIGIAFSIGFVVGPGIGAYFARTGDYSTPAVACLLLSLTSLLTIIFFLDETLEKKYRAKVLSSEISSYIWPPYLFQFKPISVGEKLRPIGLAYFIYIFIYSGLEFTLTFLTQAKFKFTPKEQGAMFTLLGVLMALLQGGLTRRLKPDMESSAAMIGMLVMMPAFVVLGFATDLSHLSFGLFCYSIGSAVCGPTLTSITSSKVERNNERGAALGIFRSLGALARGFGPLAASSLFWRFGPSTAYAIGAVTFIIPLILLRKATH